jgi:hypothetical protein
MARNAGVFAIAVMGTSPVRARLAASRPDAASMASRICRICFAD